MVCEKVLDASQECQSKLQQTGHHLLFVRVTIVKTGDNKNNQKKGVDEHVDKLELLCVIVKSEK